MLPPVSELLLSSSVVTDLVSGRVFRHGSAPQTVAAPYVTWFAVVGVPENHLTGTPPVDAFTVQVDCWSNNTGSGALEVQKVAQAVRDAIEPHHYMTGIVVNEKDYETQRYRIGMTFSWWLARTAPTAPTPATTPT